MENTKVELVEKAVLSTTAKASARAKEKEKEKLAAEGGDTKMETDGDEKKQDSATAAGAPAATEGDGAVKQEGSEDAEMKVDGSADAAPGASSTSATSKKKGAKEQAEASYEKLPNLSRVVPAQMPFISFPSESRYLPVRPLASSQPQHHGIVRAPASPAAILESIVESGMGASGGILVLRDTRPEEDVELVEMKVFKALQLAATGFDEDQAEQNAPAAAAAPGPALAATTASGTAIDLSAPIADVPEPFEYDEFDD